MADVKIRVIGEDQASQVLKGIDAEVGGFSNKFTELSSKINIAVGALRTLAAAAEQAFAWGKEGAAIAQTAQSFDMLLEKVGAAPDLLQQLRDASRGTVDDITLMASAMNTAAGADDALARSLLENSPRLLEIAKAANKLNPTLGDTTFMFESLTAGIKRQSPLLIDNTGLRLKLGEANEKMAKSLGKTVEELTAAEQQQALLNATLEAGDRLINQVGGTTDSATDAYAQLEVAIKEAGNELKVSFEPAVRAAAKALTDLLNGYKELQSAQQSAIDTITEEKKTWDEYYPAVKASLEAQGLYVKEKDGFIQVFRREGQVMREVTDEYNLLSKVVMDAAGSANVYADGSQRVATVNEIVASTTAEVDEATEAAARSLEAFAEASRKLFDSALSAGLGGKVQEGWDAYIAKTDELKGKNAELLAEINRLISEGFDPASTEVQELTAQYNANVAEQERLRQATNLATKEFIFQQAAQTMTGQAQLMLARSLGILSEADYNLATSIANLNIQFDKNQDGLLETDEATGEYEAQLKLLAQTSEVVASALEPYTAGLREQTIAATQARIESQRLADVQEALEAGLSGRLQSAMDTYQRTVGEAAAANHELVQEYWNLVASGEANQEQLAALGAQIDANNAKQIEALEVMKKSTAELIYQQAAQGLSSDAALVLARGLGLVSESDYNLIIQLQALRMQFDSNHDGMISAAEGADAYTAAVLRLYDAQVKLMAINGGGPGGGSVGGAGYQGNGIYVGGPGETIGPGTMPSAATAPGVYTAQAGQWAVPVTYNNYGVTMSDATALQQVLTPIVQNINAGR